MRVQSISLTNFRSYEDAQFAFDKERTLIVGQNGVGKTNVLEALYVLGTGRSFRDDDASLLRYTSPWWRVSGLVDGVNREVRFQPEEPRPKRLIVDAVTHYRITQRHRLPVVLFEPDDLYMIHAAPSARRNFLDGLIERSDQGYRVLVKKYERALMQRNNLVKRATSAFVIRDNVFVWDIALAEYGAEITKRRSQLVDDLNRTVQDRYIALAGRTAGLSLVYIPKGASDAQTIARQLEASLERDIVRRSTSVGPHRDDLDFILNGASAKLSASRGEVRTIVLALKQCEFERIVAKSGETPLVLLDDVFSELDNERQRNNRALFSGAQLIATTTSRPRSGFVGAKWAEYQLPRP